MQNAADMKTVGIATVTNVLSKVRYIFRFSWRIV